ncbi:MAG: hypothetical protein C4330_06460 [Chitinophagaceae bacterium]
MVLLAYGIIVTLFWVGLTVFVLYNKEQIQYLCSIDLSNTPEEPVVIIIAVRNEEEHLANALQSVCKLSYTNYRLLLINDRSTDGTAVIMQSFQQQYPHIEILQIDTLPKGWLGKNHALYQGYLHTSEKWMLFTDADVVFAPDSLVKAMQYATSRNIDHLTILPEVESRSKWLNSILATFVILLEAKQRPWALSNPKSSAFLGIGAFNLINRDAYQKIGTHKAFALRPDDDLMLGKRIKESGLKQDALYGEGMIGLEWYTSVKEFINGLMKNTFTAFRYNFLIMVVAGLIPTLLLFVLPLPLLFLFGDGMERAMALFILLAQIILFSFNKGNHSKWWYAFMEPVAGAILAYILVRASFLAIKQKGIYWRESFYSLDELKKGF